MLFTWSIQSSFSQVNVSTSLEGDSLNQDNLRITLAFNSFPRGEVGITNSSHLYL